MILITTQARWVPKRVAPPARPIASPLRGAPSLANGRRSRAVPKATAVPAANVTITNQLKESS